MVDLIAPSKAFGYTPIYLDFLAGLHSARHFYSVDNIQDVTEQLDTITYDRDAIADILRRQNESYGASPQTLQNIELLRNEKTLCVFSGQQACLFGGPLLILLKALAIVKAADSYSRQLGRPVVPIFWIAGDDHDFEEANHTYVLSRQSEPVRIAYETAAEEELPVAEVTLSDEAALAATKVHLRDNLGETDFTGDLYELIDSCYTSSDTLVSAFAKLMTAITKDYGLAFFSPGDAAAKRLAASLFESIVGSQEELYDLLTFTNQHILQHGYHVQVEKKENASHLFCNLDGRKPIMREGDRFEVGDRSFSQEELLGMIDREPHLFSPDVMTRPVMQSYLFPVLSQKGGPAEIAYLAQVNPIFPLFARVAPYYRARASATLIEKRFEKTLRELDIAFEELAGDIEQVINRVLSVTFPSDLEQRFKTVTDNVDKQFEDLVNNSLQFDSSLKSFSRQIYGKIDYALKQFEGKVFASHKRKSQQTRDRIYRLQNTLYPNRALQERSLNMSYFISKYGMDIIPFVYEQLDSEAKDHQLLYVSDMRSH